MPAELVSRVKSASDQRAWLALELIDFDPKYARVMEFVFGNTFVSANEEVARNISSGNQARAAVTLRGDKYGTEGTLSGGFV